MSNNIKAVAKVKETRITYIYQHEGIDYEIETPKTELNQGVEDGELVHIMLSVMPWEFKPLKIEISATATVEKQEQRIIDDE